jgi:hypothetical protein
MTGLFADNQVDLVQGDLEKMVTQYARSFARSNQRTVGPSELGTACERRLAMSLLGTEPCNDERDEWTSSVGTAIHSWMESACLYDNKIRMAAGLPPRWLTEATVEIETGLKGHTDAYDLMTHTVCDWKFPGVTSIRKYRKAGGPPQEYLWQAHTYGLGWKKLGFPVKKVAISFFPRSGLIRDTWLWSADYDESIARKALDRKDGLLVGMNIAEEQGSLNEFMNLLRRDTTNCTWCPFWGGSTNPGPSPDPLVSCGGMFEDPDYADPRLMKVPGIIM